MTTSPKWRGSALAAALALATPLAAQTPPSPAPPPAQAEEKTPAEKPWYEKVKISGYVFGDAYAVVAHHDPEIEGANGFWLRRAYLTFDFAIAETWSARFRLEADSPGDFETGARLEPFVKDAYLAWKDKGHELYLGIASSPTFELAENFWGYRHLEKTPIDLYRMGRSRDFGVAYKGKAAEGKLTFHVMLGNGDGEGSETNEGKKVMFSLAFAPAQQVVLEIYADTEDRPESADRTTYHAFAGFKSAKSRYGVEYALQDRQVADAPDQSLAVGSVFGVWDCAAKLSLIARFDRAFDGNPEAAEIPYLVLANNTRFDFALLGLDYKVHPKISLIPNLEYVVYRETDGLPPPDDDLIARLTLFFQF